MTQMTLFSRTMISLVFKTSGGKIMRCYRVIVKNSLNLNAPQSGLGKQLRILI